MTQYAGKQSNYDDFDEFVRALQAGKIPASKMPEAYPRTSTRRRKPREHKIGRVHIYFSMPYSQWVVTVDGNTAGSGPTARTAIESARRKYPRKPKKIHGGIVAVRFWGTFLQADGPMLASLNGTLWPGPVQSSGILPSVRNQSGIYCFAITPSGLARAGIEVKENNRLIRGIVEAYGRVVRHTHGYRAEHVVIRALDVHPEMCWPPFVEALERRYECPVRNRRVNEYR